jgi:nucleoside-diphosphate-sugar epimerase
MDEVPQGVELVAADLYDAAAVRKVAQGAAVAYQCAQPHYWEWPEKFPPLQAAIIEGLAGGGTRLVIAENLYMYGDTDGRPLTEELPYRAHTRKGKVRAAMAEAALAAHRAGKVKVAIGRASDFFGPWALGSSHGERVFYPALAGKAASFLGKLDIPHSATYISDFGRALVLLGERDEALGQAWHVPNDRPQITQRQFAELIFEGVGLPPKARGMGKLMLRLGGLFVPAAREMVEMAYEFEKPFVVDSSKFEKAFGMKGTPLPEAIRETVAWYRQHSELAGS